MKSIDSNLALRIIEAHGAIQKKIGGALDAHGLGLSEYLVLHRLNSAPNQRMRRIDLAMQIGLSPSGVTRLLNPMEKTGLVEKEKTPRDARVSLVALSTAGCRVLREAGRAFDHAAAALLEPIDATQKAHLLQLLAAVSRASGPR